MNYNTLATIISGVSLAAASWFGNSVSNLATKIDTVSNAEAATAQKTDDVDVRLTRIENKLDQVIQNKTAIR
jgi:prefoldin subunit 5